MTINTCKLLLLCHQLPHLCQGSVLNEAIFSGKLYNDTVKSDDKSVFLRECSTSIQSVFRFIEISARPLMLPTIMFQMLEPFWFAQVSH